MGAETTPITQITRGTCTTSFDSHPLAGTAVRGAEVGRHRSSLLLSEELGLLSLLNLLCRNLIGLDHYRLNHILIISCEVSSQAAIELGLLLLHFYESQ